MTSRNTNNLFLSQPLSHRLPPVIMPLKNDDSRYDNNSQEKKQEEAMDWQWTIEVSLIPKLNRYYMLEPTSITIKETPVFLLQSRLSDFFRLQSISYTYVASAVRLDCVTSNMLKFVVQFWRVSEGTDSSYLVEPNRALIVELQRRQGSVVEMQTIRRKMFAYVTTGDQDAAKSAEPRHLAIPDTILAEFNDGYDPAKGLVDALEIALRLLESNCFDQKMLGLESLLTLTDSSIVTSRDALIVSKAIAFQEGPLGTRLQSAIRRQLGGHYTGDGTNNYPLVLALLANVLQQVTNNIGPVQFERETMQDVMESPFWGCVLAGLSRNIEMAVENPHEAAKSARCIRLLLSLAGDGAGAAIKGSGWRSCLVQANRYGKQRHLLLEEESQRLLDTC